MHASRRSGALVAPTNIFAATLGRTRKYGRLFGLLAFGLMAPLAACATTEKVEVKPEDPKQPTQDPSSTIPSVSDVDSFCTSLCDRQQACDSGLDHQTCKNDCTNTNAAIFPKLREDVVNLMVECFGAKDCKTVLAGEVVNACASEAVASVAPSSAATDFCDAHADAKKKCGSTASKATCLNDAKLYDDEAIAQAKNCTGRTCTEIDSCVTAALGKIGSGTVTPPEEPTCSTGQFSELGSCSTCAETACCAEAAACAADSSGYCRNMMRYCSYTYGSSSSCSSYRSSASSQTIALADAYFACAQSKCTSTCGYYSY